VRIASVINGEKYVVRENFRYQRKLSENRRKQAFHG
jgi:uncharacterized protein YlzI (FlbEa/FlbD family)